MKKNKTPYIKLSLETIKENLDFFTKTLGFKNQEIYYPVKVNSDENILNLLKKEEVNFETGAISEIENLLKLGILPENILYGNPVKSDENILKAYSLGINIFGLDSLVELEKIAKLAPNSKVYFRLNISNQGAEWDLTKKFGCSKTDLFELFRKSKTLGLNPCGISFHVGWNNDNIENWNNVFEYINELKNDLINQNFSFEFINIGSGFPAHKNDGKENLKEIAKIILPYLNKWRKENIKLIAEPGSFLVAYAGILHTKIIEIIEKKGKKWVFVDTGIFQGFYWILSGLNYNIRAEKPESNFETEEFVVCGPSCDTHDVFSYKVKLPKSIKKGDILCVEPAGAYIFSAKEYNGFSYPIQIVE
ncbi:MAG: hypothetical protein M0Q45_01480 [Bacteroidales bacterium]|nr:hypothetical protein [Bacteroidales bacterium]MCK9498157.1 hypothetical protein [Bacteroidales bacterium]